MKFPPIMTLVNIINENKKNNMNIAEIGVFDGNTTKNYLNILKEVNGTLYAVDWFHGNENVEGYHSFNSNNENTYKLFLESIYGFENYIKILKGKTSEKILEIPDKSLDICFIDADHRYLNVKKDIELCLPKMKDNGIICGHDFEGFHFMPFSEKELELDTSRNCHPGVIQAVYEYFNKDIEILPECIWLKRLRK